MSEQNTCIECNHNVIHHDSALIKPDIRGLCAMCRSIGSLCSRTYESLVGEKGKTCPCQDWQLVAGHGIITDGIIHHPNCDGTGGVYDAELPIFEINADESAKDEQDAKPELQLLVIDLGDACVVKVEKGSLQRVWLAGSQQAIGNVTLSEGESALFGVPFTELREALDGKKPFPRLLLKDDGRYELQFKTYMGESHRSFKPEAYQALSELAGKPLPIWEGGKWEEIKGGYVLGNSDTNSLVELPCKIYRYTK